METDTQHINANKHTIHRWKQYIYGSRGMLILHMIICRQFWYTTHLFVLPKPRQPNHGVLPSKRAQLVSVLNHAKFTQPLSHRTKITLLPSPKTKFSQLLSSRSIFSQLPNHGTKISPLLSHRSSSSAWRRSLAAREHESCQH